MGELALSVVKVSPADLKDIERYWPEPPLAELILSRKLTESELRYVDKQSDIFAGFDGHSIQILGFSVEKVRDDTPRVQGRVSTIEREGKALKDAQTEALTRAQKAAEEVFPSANESTAPNDRNVVSFSRFSRKGALYLWWRVWRGIVALAATFFAVGLVLGLYAASQSEEQGDGWDRVSTAGIGIAFTTAATVVATAAFKAFESARARDRERSDFLAEVVVAYNSVKSVRRHLLALGLRVPRAREWDSDDAKGLHKLMSQLNEAQLKFEALCRKAEFSEIFADQPQVAKTLREVESYLNSVLKRWEEHAAEIDKNLNLSGLARLKLRSLLDTKNFRKGASDPLVEIIKHMQARLFGSSKPSRWVGSVGLPSTRNGGHGKRMSKDEPSR